MPTLQQTSSNNFEASINDSFADAIAAYGLPSWLPTRPTVTHDWAEIPASLPCFGTTHIPVTLLNAYQGQNVGGGKRGMMYRGIYEISCFVNRTNNSNWHPQLRTMVDMALTWAGDAKQVLIVDYAANQSSPASTEYLVQFGDIAPNAWQPDNANPSILRQRILIDYQLVYRVA